MARLRPLSRRAVIAASVLLLFALTVAFQLRNGAYDREFDFDADSHALSGLMIRDYLAGFAWSSPITFMRDFHGHYPLIGIGHWPPLWYGVEAAWMLAFGANRAALLTLAAATTAATATVLASLAGARFGRRAGLLAGAMFVAVRFVQSNTADMLLDGAVALACLLAMLAYARFLRTARVRDGVMFGLAAAAAMLVKGNGVLLALLPPLVVLIGRRWDLVRRPGFWAPVPVVAILAGPWSVITYGQVTAGFRHAWGVDYYVAANVYDVYFLLGALGPLVVMAALFGLGLVVALPRLRDDPVLTCGAALLVATWLFQTIVPAALQDRYLLPLLSPLLMLMLVPVGEAQRRWPAMPALTRLAAPLLLAASMLPLVGDVALRPVEGFRAAAAAIRARRTEANPSVLIATQDEGVAIIELALRDPHRPSLFAVRGSRLLGDGGYNQEDYAPRFETPAQAMAAIDAYAIPMALFQPSRDPDAWAHLTQIEAAAAAFPDRWKLVWQDESHDAPLRLYEVVGNSARNADRDALRKLSAPKGLGE